MQALRRQLVDSVHAFASIYRNPSLRRLQLAWIGSSVGTWGYVVALMVYAYRQGGPAAVGLVGLIRWFPAAVAAPFGGMLGDRFPRLRVMVVSDLLRAAALALAAAAIVLDAPAVIVYLLAILVTLVSQAFGPAESALLPTLADSPEELASANVASSTIEAAGYFVGPALGGVVLAVSNVETVFVLTAVAFLWSAAVLALIRLRAPEPTAEGTPRQLAARSARRIPDHLARLAAAPDHRPLRRTDTRLRRLRRPDRRGVDPAARARRAGHRLPQRRFGGRRADRRSRRRRARRLRAGWPSSSVLR
jgi:MFS family permease